MVTQRQNELLNAKVFTKSAAARILGYKWGIALDSKNVQIRHYYAVIWVHVKGHSPRFVSKRQFVEHFQEMRLAQSQSPSLRVNLSGSLVENITKGTKYHICGSEYDCNCYDYTSQNDDFVAAMRHWNPIFRPVCKHRLAYIMEAANAAKRVKVERKSIEFFDVLSTGIKLLFA